MTILNSTVDGASALFTLSVSNGYYSSVSFRATNSVFANVTNITANPYDFGYCSGARNGFYNTSKTFGSSPVTAYSSPFQVVGTGCHYLDPSSGFIDAGTMNGIPASLQADLARRTTYPPYVVAQDTLTWDPWYGQYAQRDLYVFDLGYHYDPLDYALGGVTASGTTVTVQPGTAIATFATNNAGFGLSLGADSSLNSVGTPVAPIWVVSYNTVMEGTNTDWKRPTNSVTGATVSGRFTSWSVPAQDVTHFYAPSGSGSIGFQDSEFHSGKLGTYGPALCLTNCLLERVTVKLASAAGNVPYVRNSLLYGGTFDYAPAAQDGTVKDNLFDQTLIPSNNVPYNSGYNAFLTNNNRLYPMAATDKIFMTNAVLYQKGPFGTYYQTNNTPLLDGGSVTAASLGLDTYTILTNQTVDAGMVDIGYHYPTFSTVVYPPVAYATAATVCPSVTSSIWGNAYDPNGLPLTYVIVTRPAHGTLTYGNNLGEFIYVPVTCYRGSDTFTYKVTNGYMDSPAVAATITVADTLYSTSYGDQTCMNTPLNITLSSWDDCGQSESTFTYTYLKMPTNGTLTGVMPNVVYTPTVATFSGEDSFTYRVRTSCGDMVTNTAKITIGDRNVVANDQTAMAGSNQPVNLTLSGSSPLGCAAPTVFTIVNGPSHGTLTGTGANRTYTPAIGFEGVDTFTFTVNDGTWVSAPATVTIYVVGSPKLTALCNPEGPGVLLQWTLTTKVQEMVQEGFTIRDFQIYRSLTSGGPYDCGNPLYTVDGAATNKVDMTVTPGLTYYYVMVIEYQDPYTGNVYPVCNIVPGKPPYSNQASITACVPPLLGAMDVVFIVDNTGSMSGSIGAIQQGITNMIDYIVSSSGNDYRLSLVTPDNDQVNVRVSFATANRVAFQTEVMALIGTGGNGTPESTDECLNTVVNALPAAGRINPNPCTPVSSPLQIGNFTAFRTNVLKRVVMITDAPPSGFCDADYTLNRAQQYAQQAAATQIKINAIQIGGDGNAYTALHDYYAAITCGWYDQLDGASTPDDVKAAILYMLYNVGLCGY